MVLEVSPTSINILELIKQDSSHNLQTYIKF